MPDDLNDREPTDGTFILSARLVALVALIIAAASTTTLLLVARSEDADALSTTALVLAVLSFMAQLLIAMAQSADVARQQTENARIAGQAQAALSEIRTLANDFAATLRTQFDRVLGYALKDAADEAEPDEAELTERVVERIRQEFDQRLAVTVPDVAPSVSPLELYRGSGALEKWARARNVAVDGVPDSQNSFVLTHPDGRRVLLRLTTGGPGSILARTFDRLQASASSFNAEPVLAAVRTPSARLRDAAEKRGIRLIRTDALDDAFDP